MSDSLNIHSSVNQGKKSQGPILGFCLPQGHVICVTMPNLHTVVGKQPEKNNISEWKSPLSNKTLFIKIDVSWILSLDHSLQSSI